MKHRPLLFTALAVTAAVALTGHDRHRSPLPVHRSTQGSRRPRGGGQVRTAHREDGPRRPARPRSRLPTARLRGQDARRGQDRRRRHPGLLRPRPRRRTPQGDRLRQPLLGTVPDQDVVVAPGEPKVLAITDPYKSAGLTLKVTDKATGKGLAGAIVNIAPKDAKDDKGTLTLTTGPDGTAKAPLPVGKKTGSAYTATETKVPDGYRLETTPVEITAKPGAETTAAFTNAATAKPTEEPTGKPTAKPTGDPTSQPTPTGSSSTGTGEPTDAASPSSGPEIGTAPATPTAPDTKPEGSLAHTGADSTNGWLLAAGGLLLAAGGSAVYAARRRKNDESDTGTGQHRRTDDN